MSIPDAVRNAIRECCDDQRIRLVEPLILGSRPRVLYATTELHAVIFDPASFRMGELRRTLDRFTLGERITVGRKHEDTCLMKPLDPPTHGVWEIRSRDPKPSLRVFGQFLCQDVFVATNYEERIKLGHKRSREFAVEIGACVAAWRRLFPHCVGYHGDALNAYLSNAVEINAIP